MVRLLETRSGSVVGATGALYAIRKVLFVPPPDGLVLDDVWVPMHCAKAGFRVVLEQDAHVTDVEADPVHERSRKVRTLAGNRQLFDAAPWMRSRKLNPLYLRTLIHKRARLYAPLAVATLIATSRPARIVALATLGLALVRRRHPMFGGRLGAAAEAALTLTLSAARALVSRGPISWR